MTPTKEALSACIAAMEKSTQIGCTDHLDCCDDAGKFWSDAIENGKQALTANTWRDIKEPPRGIEILVRGGDLHGEVNGFIGHNSVSKVVTTNGTYFSVCDTDTYACWIQDPTGWQHIPETEQSPC